ncbi:MAG: phospholipase D family protein [Acidobacteria bacterium]|nr:phospholipase D family protein [Acidobacteriota bacterium]
MLLPDSRTVAFDLIRPPSGYRLDFAVLTTYTLDLEALLALPLSVLAHPDGGLEELLADPLRLHQAIREAGDRVHAFVDETGIAIPHGARPLYSMLESSVHPVRAPNGGSFHPKVWVARFTAAVGDARTAKDAEGSPPPDLLRVAILSRNLTFDRSWDVALVSEAPPRDVRRRVTESRPLGDFLSALPQLATTPIDQVLAARVQTLAHQVARTAFPAPEGFDSPIAFHALGLSRSRRTWQPPSTGYRMLAIAPFVNRTGLDAVARLSDEERILVSRREELDKLSGDALADWNKKFVLADTAQDEAEDEDGAADRDEPAPVASARPAGLHAKMFAIEHGWDVTWYLGSANLTHAAFTGSNVEAMASIKGRKGGTRGHGIDRFLDGFQKLCVLYERTEPEPVDAAVTSAQERLEAAREALVNASLRVTCASEGELWRLTVAGSPTRPTGDVKVAAWPISIPEDDARPLVAPPNWILPVARLTAFIAFRLHVPVRGVDDIRLTLRLPAEGMPSDRLHQVLRSLLDSPEKFLRFLRALLGGLDATVDWAKGEGDGPPGADWGIGAGGDTLLDDLVRTAARDPDRLKPVRRLIDDLRKTDEGRRIVPDDLFEIWTAVEEALAPEPRP